MKSTFQYCIALKSLLFDLHLNLYKLPILNPKTYRKIFGKLNLTSSFITSWSIRLTSKSFLSLDINTCTRVSGADAPAVKPIFGDFMGLNFFKNKSSLFSLGIKIAFFTP